MHFQPAYHQEFHFADNTDSKGLCCCWSSKSKPREYLVDNKLRLTRAVSASRRERILANQRLAKIVKNKFENDPIKNDIAFDILKAKINDTLDHDEPITSERLARIVNAIYEVREEARRSASPPSN